MNTPALELANVCYAYPDGMQALDDVNLRVRQGERVALVGANSAGKSSLLLHCNGSLSPARGTVRVLGTEITPQSLTRVRKDVGTIFQEADDQLFMATIAEDVAFGPRNMGLAEEEIRTRVDEALAAAGCAHLAQRQPQHLSGGEKRAAALATVLAMRPRILLMDEPTANLDPYARRQFIRLMRTLPHTLLMATHDLDLVLEVCPRTVILHQGRVKADGDTHQLLTDTALLESCRLEQPLCMQGVPAPPAPASA